MENKKLMRFVESFLLLPMMALSMPLGSIPKNITPIPEVVSSQTEYIQADATLAYNQALEQKQTTLDIKAEAIDAYFKNHHMPLAGTGTKMVEAAEKNNLDWRLLPAIAVRESTGGKHACTSVPNSFFGWGSCKIGFKSADDAIEALARNLSGNDKDTAYHYSGKTTKEILQKYNPPSIVPNYASQVIEIMDAIGDKDVVITPQPAVS